MRFWIQLVQDRIQWQALVDTNKPLVSTNGWILLVNERILSFFFNILHLDPSHCMTN
jgi:hypothetical protein